MEHETLTPFHTKFDPICEKYCCKLKWESMLSTKFLICEYGCLQENEVEEKV